MSDNQGNHSPTPPSPSPSSPTPPLPLAPLPLAPLPIPTSLGNLSSISTQISSFTLNETIDISGAKITNQQGQDINGNIITNTTFQTTDLSANVNVTEDLSGYVTSFYQDTNAKNIEVLNEIKDYALKINCTDFQGKGTIEDYSQLFQAASKIANDVTQIKLDVDTQGFADFGSAADELSALFTSFTLKLQSVSIIDDLSFLQSISSALKKIWNLSEVFGKFKETILATSTVELPQSSHDASIVVKSVISELDCAMNYINYFVSPSPNAPVPTNAALTVQDKNIINNAVTTINNWSVLCSQGVTIAMSNSKDITYIKSANNKLEDYAALLKKNSASLKSNLALYNIYL